MSVLDRFWCSEARRIADAFAQGCDLVTTGSYKPEPGKHNPSLANMLRLGFEAVADRTPQIWRLA